MSKLGEIIDQEWRNQKQRREIDELRSQNEKLQSQVERMRGAMRRCVSCEYHPRNRTDADG